MKSAGIIQILIRERHPFAVLAILAFLIPALFTAVGLTGTITSFRLADGTTVICTGDGFVRISDPAAVPDSGLQHDRTDCCGSGCVHAGGMGLAALGAPLISQPLVFGERLSPAAVASDRPAAPHLPGTIRAPPARSV
jgi:hypothetical protein